MDELGNPNQQNSINNPGQPGQNLEPENTQDMKTPKKKSNIGSVIIVIILVLVIAGAAILKFYPNLFSLGGPDPERIAEMLDSTRRELIEGDYDEAVRYAEETIQENGAEDIQALVLLANSYLQKGSSSFQEEEYALKAIEVADAILEIVPDESEAFRIKGYANEIMQNYDEAIRFYERAIEISNGFALAYSQLGHVYDLMGDKETAFLNYGKALFLDPGLDHARINTGYIHFTNRDFAKAKDILNKVLEDAPDSATESRTLIILGLIDLEEGNFADAIEKLEATVEADENYAGGWAALSSAYIAVLNGIPEGQGDQVYIDLVTESTDKALELHEYNTYAMINKANLKLMYEDCTGAVRMFNDALDMIENDITLGAFEKEETRNYILESVSFCNNL